MVLAYLLECTAAVGKMVVLYPEGGHEQQKRRYVTISQVGLVAFADEVRELGLG